MENMEVIGLNVAGNYSDQFGSNKILVLFCEGPKPNISTNSGFLDPLDPFICLFILIYKIISNRKVMETLKTINFVNLY